MKQDDIHNMMRLFDEFQNLDVILRLLFIELKSNMMSLIFILYFFQLGFLGKIETQKIFHSQTYRVI